MTQKCGCLFICLAVLLSLFVVFPARAQSGLPVFSPAIEYVNITHTEYVVVERNNQYVAWESEEVLHDWLNKNNDSGAIYISPTQPDGVNVCALRAFRLRATAANDKRYLSFQLLTPQMYQEVFGIESDRWHLFIMAVVPSENMLYWYDPEISELWAICKYN